MKMNKTVALVLALTLVIGVAVGGTLAWLTAESGEVKNVFTTSHMGVKLEETTTAYQMVPGWAIAKDPYATVDATSEDCYLFVEITGKLGETAVTITKDDNNIYHLDDYLVYAVREEWQPVEGYPNVFYKVIDDSEGHKKGEAHYILGDGSYTDPMNKDGADLADVTVYWGNDQVCVKPSVTEAMMNTAESAKPTLSFSAYAFQLYKTGSVVADGQTANAKFDVVAAWEQVSGTNP